MKKIKKILIANRGEIALRIIRTCRDMNIGTVAVYSEADRLSPHVLMADEAYYIGPPPASESYLNMEALLDVARKARADAIHPGYGFLAENAQFARRVRENHFIFIGPPAETIELMGSKTASRKTMIEAGVPVVPGTTESLETPEQAQKALEGLGGYPVLIKAAAGGGGKGMRIVRAAKELPRALEAARREARKAFGDETVYLEKYIEAPKHIEIQILADLRGNLIHLWERDCSIQRRHQKVIEECPSAVLTPEKRQEMGRIALQAAKACGYQNAGTVEFLFDRQGKFYFLEMNTRLQVEHPVTELVMGVDLVNLQIAIAEGHPIPFPQEHLIPKGHAIECRINAEDVHNNFVPSTGKILYLKHPEGPGVRVDSGIDQFSEISPFYDSLIAKLIVWADSRKEAMRRMKRALGEFQIQGVKTTIPFCLQVLDHPAFVEGDFTTKFVEQYWDSLKNSGSLAEEIVHVMAVAIAYHHDANAQPPAGVGQNNFPGNSLSPWKLRALKEMNRLK